MIENLHIENVRILKERDFEFKPETNVIFGKNGSGKTSILESIYLLSQGFSFRTRDTKELIQWNASHLILRGNLKTHEREFQRALQIEKTKNLVRENGVNLKSPSAFFGKSPAIIMQPSDLELLRGSPEIRRRWLDEILCFRSLAHSELLKKFKRILQQRNSILRAQKISGEPLNKELFEILTMQFVELSAQVFVARLSLTEELAPLVENYYHKLSNGAEKITCEYKSSIFKYANEIPQKTEERILSFKNAFQNHLRSLELAEKAAGITLSGPHKDDLKLSIQGFEMRSVGSQGQCRSAALAMRFSAVDTANIYLAPPILLLDDILAELDNFRRQAVVQLILEKKLQVIIATPSAKELPFSSNEIELS